MKFGRKISDGMYSEWARNYIDYSGLKKELKSRQSGADKSKEWDDVDESHFLKRLQDELSKVYNFQEAKIQTIFQQLSENDQSVQELMNDKKTAKDEEHQASGSRHDADGDSDEDDDEEVDPEIEAKFEEIEADLEILIADVHDLSKFTHLNYTGFVKITKKHDKRTGFPLKAEFLQTYLDKLPFHKEQYDELIIELSKLYNLVRTRGNPVMGDSAAGGGQSDFVRQTTKYWVHPDNMIALKLAILKHLPVLVFDPDKDWASEDSAITSVYFDNEELDLYLGRLEKTEGAQAIRLRWYGGMGVKQIFVERKTHREDWTGEKSVKARFPIKEDQVNKYLSGELDMGPIFESEGKKKGKKQSDIDNNTKLAREVQQTVREKRLQPVMRTFYNRTAFQLPGDARVRISLDTSLTLIREDNWDGRSKSGTNWRRMDIGVDFPFDQLKPEDVHRFPYGVLEVKLQTQAGQQPPEWAKELVSSHLVEAVPKFSKFIHGCATLLNERVPLVPFWLPQMDVSILKPESESKKAAIITRPTGSNNQSATVSSTSTPAAKTPEEGRSALQLHGYSEPLSDDEDDQQDDLQPRAVGKDETLITGIPANMASQAEEAKASREKAREKERSDSGKTAEASNEAHQNARKEPQFAKLTPQNLERLLQAKYQSEQKAKQDAEAANQEMENGAVDPTGSGATVRTPEYVNSFRAPSGKLVSVPIRIEPKVYFANERTFLAWVEFSVLLSAIGIGLMNFTPQHDAAGLAAGISFTIVALLAIAYAGIRFVWRAINIRQRKSVRYDDLVGPTVLCVILLIAIVMNFIWRAKEGPANMPV